jgi:hypothetical protein
MSLNSLERRVLDRLMDTDVGILRAMLYCYEHEPLYGGVVYRLNHDPRPYWEGTLIVHTQGEGN